MRRRHRRPSDVIRGLLALFGLLAIAGGVPSVLLALGANPIPSRMPGWAEIRSGLLRPDDGTLLVGALQTAVWLLWTLFTVLVIAEAVSQLRGHPLPRMRGLGFLQQPAAALVTAAAVLLAPTGTSPPLQVTATTVLAAPPDDPLITQAAAQPDHEQHAAKEPAPDLPRYTVRRYDNLWRIAERHLGDGLRWGEIYNLNADQISNPDHIQPGMMLALPADARGLDRATQREVTVGPDDSLSLIAQRELGDAALWPTLFDANRGRAQPDGNPFTNPNLLLPGFTVIIPATAATAQPPPASPPDLAPPTPAQPPPQSPSPQPTPSIKPTSTTTALPTPTEEPTQTSAASPTLTDVDEHHVADTTITLPSGAIVGFSLAAAISAAVMLLLLHRRRRYRVQPLAMRSIRYTRLPEATRRLRRAQASTAQPDLMSPVEPHPGPVAIAFDGDHEVPVDPVALRGLGLTGDGADAAARAILVTYLARHRPQHVEILLPQRDLDCLFDGVDGVSAAPLPENLTIVDSLDTALIHVESEQIRRARLLDAADAADMSALRAATPDESLPLIVLFATPDPRHLRHIAAVLQLGADRDIGAVLLGDSPSGPTYQVNQIGEASTDNSHAGAPHQLRFFTLAATEALDLLTTIAEAQGVEPADREVESLEEPEPSEQQPPRFPIPGQRTPHAEPPAPDKPVSLTLFGPPKLAVHGEEIATGLRSNARELLLYLALHPRGATLDQALEAMWPDTEVSRARESFHAAVGNIRKVLRTTTELTGEKFLMFANDRYRLDPNLIDVDVWHFEQAVEDAQRADDPTVKAAALTEATRTYTGELAADLAFEWLDIDREDLRRRALDAHSALADLYESDDAEAALAILERATRHEPYTEELYVRIMRIQARLGRRDAIRRTYRLLQARLADIGAEPEQTTQQLLHRLLADSAHSTSSLNKPSR